MQGFDAMSHRKVATSAASVSFSANREGAAGAVEITGAAGQWPRRTPERRAEGGAPSGTIPAERRITRSTFGAQSRLQRDGPHGEPAPSADQPGLGATRRPQQVPNSWDFLDSWERWSCPAATVGGGRRRPILYTYSAARLARPGLRSTPVQLCRFRSRISCCGRRENRVSEVPLY